MTSSELPAIEISFSSSESAQTVERNTRVVKRDLRDRISAYGGRVVAATEPGPPGSRSAGVATVGTVLAHVPVALQAVVDMVKILNAWVTERAGRQVALALPDGTTLEIVYGAATTEATLVSAVLERLPD
ncbi:hypothetical protein Aab01nite_78510 [Paractinoplanes abujensis]|uniref:Uncharacterized protein n=1 Tax=Paractinoplanes abujensis TaxID=882441 RepID=A0A7W7G146_9ACTN|nr:hypothetical protein [Actinoplanes abujensis]MBB4692259.1 hypothetical protein [Actinoplanes abujensis]GID24261.1 hypothetical protein Aab01nite_78510 [Actinoplanes abujensis]